MMRKELVLTQTIRWHQYNRMTTALRLGLYDVQVGQPRRNLDEKTEAKVVISPFLLSTGPIWPEWF
jgi:hypothetical protein